MKINWRCLTKHSNCRCLTTLSSRSLWNDRPRSRSREQSGNHRWINALQWENGRVGECESGRMGECEKSGAEKSNLGTTCRYHDGVNVNVRMGKWENGKCENGRMRNYENGRMGEDENVIVREWDTGRTGATAWSSPVTWCENVIYGYVWILYLILS